jgi:hypothetical protein
MKPWREVLPAPLELRKPLQMLFLYQYESQRSLSSTACPVCIDPRLPSSLTSLKEADIEITNVVIRAETSSDKKGHHGGKSWKDLWAGMEGDYCADTELTRCPDDQTTWDSVSSEDGPGEAPDLRVVPAVDVPVDTRHKPRAVVWVPLRTR